MKNIFILFISIFVLSSCTEDFNIKDPLAFNQKIEGRIDILTAEQLIKIYYNYPPNEGIPQLDIKSKEISDGLIEIILIHDGQQDDSQRGTKVVMTAKRIGDKWIVQQIKTNRKCYEGRGHTDWGTDWCS